jgi:hypothetical protein
MLNNAGSKTTNNLLHHHEDQTYSLKYKKIHSLGIFSIRAFHKRFLAVEIPGNSWLWIDISIVIYSKKIDESSQYIKW